MALGACRGRCLGSSARPGAAIVSREKLSARLDTLPKGPLLLRGDSVAFPPDGCAYLHRHQGPGIRCLLEGGIRIDTAGHSTSYGPGGAWYESGPEPVFAQAANRPTRFIRVMILPMAYLARSSVEYLATKTRTSRGRRSTKSTPTCRSLCAELEREKRDAYRFCSRFLAMMSCWISLVPSKIRNARECRNSRSTVEPRTTPRPPNICNA